VKEMGYALEQKYHPGFKKSLGRIKLAIVYWKNVVLVSMAYTNNDVNYIIVLLASTIK